MQNFIDEYVEYASKLSASPKKFHRMMAYSMLAQCIGRRPIFTQNGPPIGPNLWCLILAPSSTMAKSSALSIGRRILSQANLGGFDHLLPVGGSSENFFERLQEKPSGIILSSEFCNLVNWFRLSYANDIPGLLIDAYDQPSMIYKSIGTNHKGNKKSYTIREPFINAYAVSSYDLFNSVITQSLLTGGFLVRWFIVREDSEDNYRPFTDPIDETKELYFANILSDIINKDGLDRTFTYEPKAVDIYTQWFNDFLKKTGRESGHSMMGAYCQRRNADVHKLAMIHAVLRGSVDTMNEQDIDQAITLCQQSIKDAIYLLENKISMSRDESDWNKIMEYIRRFSKDGHGAPHWKVLKSSKIPSFQFSRHIETLIGMKRIEKTETGTTGNVCVEYSEIHP